MNAWVLVEKRDDGQALSAGASKQLMVLTMRLSENAQEFGLGRGPTLRFYPLWWGLRAGKMR